MSPHSVASSESSASLSLSHPDSDSSSLRRVSFFGKASGKGSSTSSVGSAGFVLDSPSSQDLGASHVESSLGDTSCELSVSSSVSGTLSVTS